MNREAIEPFALSFALSAFLLPLFYLPMRVFIFILLWVYSFIIDASNGPVVNQLARTTKFIENKGQFTDDKGNPVPFVLFRSSAPGIDYFITTSGITYVFSKAEEEDDDKEKQINDPETKADSKKDEKKFYCEKIELLLKDASIQSSNIITGKPSDHHFNYFYAHCPNGIYDIKEYEKITILNVYPGIDWVFYGSSSSGFKYDFVIHPGADVNDIKLLYRSDRKPSLDKEGQLSIHTRLGVLSESAPISYQQKNGKTISSSFALISSIKQSGHYETQLGFSGDFLSFKNE